MRNRTFQVTVPGEYSNMGVPETVTEQVFGTKISTEAGVLQVWDENPDGSAAPGGRGRSHHVTHLYAPGQWVKAIDQDFA